MKQNQNAIAAIDHKCTIWIKSYVHSSVAEKNLPLSRGYFRCCRHALVAVAVVERWPLAGGLNKRKSFCWNEIK